MKLIAILLHRFSFFKGKIITVIIRIILQPTLIEFVLTTIWAIVSIINVRKGKRAAQILKAIRQRT